MFETCAQTIVLSLRAEENVSGETFVKCVRTDVCRVCIIHHFPTFAKIPEPHRLDFVWLFIPRQKLHSSCFRSLADGS